MKYRTIFSLFLGVLFLSSCSGDPDYLQRYEVVITDYPDLLQHVSDRNFSGIMEFVDHEEPQVSSLAWRALAKTDLDDSELKLLFDRVIRSDQKGGWFALSFHDLNDDHLAQVREAFQTGEIQSEEVCEVFFRLGNRADAEFLMNSDHALESIHCAKAVGGILAREEMPQSFSMDLIRSALDHNSSIIRRNLLYGYYRAALNRPEVPSNSTAELMNKWVEFGVGQDEFVDMTMVRIFGNEGLHVVMDSLSDQELNSMTGLSVDLSIAVGERVPRSDDVEPIFRLLDHKNNHVVVQTLASLAQFDRLTPQFLEQIEKEVTQTTRDAEIFVTSLNLFLRNGYRVSPHRVRLDHFAQNNPYLTDRFLVVYSALDSDQEYYERLASLIQKGGIEALHAGRMLTTFLQRPGMMNRYREEVDELLALVLSESNRSALDGLTQIFLDEELFEDHVFTHLQDAYNSYVETGSTEQAQIVGTVLEERFPDRFVPADIEFDEPFRLPDTNRLYEMGTRPFWELKTEKGTLVVRLNPIEAPFTVSSIDSLTRSGAYDGVVFHRVVRNFVAQGGDFDRRDGFGGPDYRIPTEPSYETFERGMAGIASSGTDTEGSQFFFMHRWAPHLDGHYTNFGQITRGLDVLDKLQVGDKIIEARIYPE
ncbi:peptidylprolyl isomerase [Rhodohalobacter halophilus]|uniref:peptidylprolyl isomerase n=1 Tax=Rhodohalobacter halophilus TaxID=1812810 RepID=UPI001C40158B|nr:peptidylprolyl isomerase [Rhodohalobacter halophilus]